jgi:hypothetical protein
VEPLPQPALPQRGLREQQPRLSWARVRRQKGEGEKADPLPSPSHPLFESWDDYGLRSAVYVDGSINDPKKGSKSWSVEIAFPIAHLVYNTSASVPPKNGTYWGINFSRVEWKVTVVDNTYVKVGVLCLAGRATGEEPTASRSQPVFRLINLRCQTYRRTIGCWRPPTRLTFISQSTGHTSSLAMAK